MLNMLLNLLILVRFKLVDNIQYHCLKLSLKMRLVSLVVKIDSKKFF